MSDLNEIKVPDFGDFSDVLVVDVLIAPGDMVAIEQPIVVLESDKATIEVPSPAAGRIVSVSVAPGERVSTGSPLARLEGARQSVPPAETETSSSAAPGGDAADCDILVIGGGPGGYSAAFRAADLGKKVVLVKREATLGGVCLNVGCIPSKALLHVAAVKEEAERLARHGIAFGAPAIDLEKLRQFRSSVVGRLTGGLAAMARMRKVTVLRGMACFADDHAVEVELHDGGRQRIAFRHAIVAAGSCPVHLPFLPDDPRIVDSTGALALPFIPERMLVIGGGIIGLEMATVYSALGARVDVVEQMDTLLPDADRDMIEIWLSRNAHRFDHLLLDSRVEKVVAGKDGLHVSIAGKNPLSARYDLVLQSAGRRPASATVRPEAAGIALDERGFIVVDSQMRTSAPHIFAIGDVTGNPMLAHKAVHQAHVTAEAASGGKSHMDAKIVPSVAYTDPEIAWAGLLEDAARAQGRAVKVAKFPWAASGRAIANGAEYGLTKLVFDAETHRVVGGGIVGPSAGDMIGEVCLAIEMGADSIDIGRTIHPHPTLGESIGLAAEAAEGTCTDLPPVARPGAAKGA